MVNPEPLDNHGRQEFDLGSGGEVCFESFPLIQNKAVGKGQAAIWVSDNLN